MVRYSSYVTRILRTGFSGWVGFLGRLLGVDPVLLWRRLLLVIDAIFHGLSFICGASSCRMYKQENQRTRKEPEATQLAIGPFPLRCNGGGGGGGSRH